DEATIQKAKITEPFGYIIKPFEERDLKTTIEMALYKYKTDLLLNNKEKWLSTVFNNISEGIITTDMEGNIEFMNKSAEYITGYKIDDACKNHYSKVLKVTSEETGEEIFDFVSKCIKEGVEVIINDYVNLINREGFETPVNITVNVLKDSSERTIGTVISFVNMSAIKNYENELTKYATTDSLTGVLNRKTGLFYLEKQIQLCKRYGNFFSIAYIDVNYLKEINEKFGENCGDEVLKIICSIIKNDIRESDTVCRLGGDEFLILFSMTSIEEARIVWERIEKKIDIYNSSKAKPFDISAACGLAQFEANDDKNLEELINIADEEMYRNKISFKNKK
ncbi:MAG TPA: diguanylate cyclase, partial [Petrotogaceae bacterium]|nr:diguanylate cyclase [Petrotogaceae bacterium]